MKPVRTWILIADGARARIVLNDGPGHGVKAMDGHEFAADLSSKREAVADRQGRSFESASDGRHAMEPATDPRRMLKQNFAGDLVKFLEEALRKNKFDRLVLVAPPAALGDLRKAMPQSVRGNVSAQLAKDLTHLPNAELVRHLETVLAV